MRATRSELLGTRARVDLAERGRELLTDKRKALLRALGVVAREALSASESLSRAATSARGELLTAEALDGPAAVRGAAWSADGELLVDATTETIMGVHIPVVERRDVRRPLAERGYGSTSTTPRVDAVAERFEDELDLVLEVASTEIRLRLLGAEISKTTRRANALEHALIPQLRRACRQIAMKLREREREEQFRLRRCRARRTSTDAER